MSGAAWSTRTLLAFLIAGLLGGGLFLALEGTPREEEPRAVTLDARVPAAERVALEPGPNTRAAGEMAEDRQPLHPPEAVASPASLPTAIEGTLVVLDERGVEHSAEDGILTLRLGSRDARALREVDVQDGRWTLSLGAPAHPGFSMVVLASVLGERLAVPAPEQAAELALPSDGQVALRMRWWRAGPLLHVRSRDTGLELEEVLLFELPPALRGSPKDARHPGPDAESLARAVGPSPVRLEGEGLDEHRTRVIYATGPGHAWGRIELDHPGTEEEQVLVLDRAGALELAVVGERQLSSMEILLLEGEPPQAEVLDLMRGTAETFLVESLPGGRYLVQGRSHGMLAGTTEVEILPGERSKAVLEIEPPRTQRVPLEGVLVLPAEWELEDFELAFRLQGRFDDAYLHEGRFEIQRSDMVLEPGSVTVYRWKAPDARAARYRVGLRPPWFFTELDTGPTGTRDARVEVPPPCTLSLRCRSEQGVDIIDDSVWFTTLMPRAYYSCGLLGGSAPGSPDGEYPVPQGRGLLLTRPGSHEPVARDVEMGPGRNEVLLILRRRP